MQSRSLFNIIIKIIGFFFLKDILDMLPTLLYNIFQLGNLSSESDSLMSFIFFGLSIGLYVFICYFLIFKTNIVIDKLKLEKDFPEETLSLNIHRSTVLSIVIMVIGGLLIADSIPLLCRSLYSYFQTRSLGGVFTNTPEFNLVIVYAFKLLTGLILLGNQQLFVNFIEKRKRKTSTD